MSQTQTTMHKNSNDNTPTLQDVIDTINTSSTVIAVELHDIKQDISGMKQDISGMKQDITRLKATAVTKEYLDEKMLEQRADLILLTRKEDRKVVALIDELRQTHVLSGTAAKKILALEPFPQ